MQATARARPLDARVRVQGGFEQGAPGRWRGQILEATQTTDPTVRMLAPALLEADLPALRARLAQGAFELDGPSGARLDLDQVEWADAKGLMARGKLSRIPVRWVDGYVAERGVRTQLPDALRLGATFDLSATLDAAGTPSLQGAVSAFRESGDLLIEAPASEGGVELLRAGLKQLDARLQFAGARAAATLQVRGDALGNATAQAEVPLQFAAGDWMPSLKVPLSGRVDVNVPSLGFTRALVGEAWRLSGVLQAQLALSGTLQQPRISGALTGKQLVAVQREFGMRLTDGELDAQVTDNQIDVRTLRFASGKGSVQMTGSLRPDDRSEAVVTLSQMPIPLGAGQRLVLSGESRATLAGGLLSLRGALRADEGVIEISSGDTPEVSSDVVVVSSRAETFSLSTAEAISCGTLVVGTAGGAVADLIEYTGAGRTFRAGDSASLGGALLGALSTDAAARRAQGIAGRARLVERYTWAAVMQRLYDVYRDPALAPLRSRR
jgi:translocation and assembly module TamB